MPLPPTLATDRLILRAYAPADAPAVQALISYEIARNTLSIPHPYPDGAAAQWIATHENNASDYPFAMTLRNGGALIGTIGIHVQPDHDRAEIGYWVGVAHWNRGYTTEAARAVMNWGFESLDLHRIFAQHFTRNAASGRVMQKLGMSREGLLRQHVRKWDEYVDVAIYSILRDEWMSSNGVTPSPCHP